MQTSFVLGTSIASTSRTVSSSIGSIHLLPFPILHQLGTLQIRIAKLRSVYADLPNGAGSYLTRLPQVATQVRHYAVSEIFTLNLSHCRVIPVPT